MRQYPQPYVEFLVQFHAVRDYFECHEIMEEYWKQNPSETLGNCWVGLIQTAVALYHQRRNNVKGAVKMLRSALVNLSGTEIGELGIEPVQFRDILIKRLHDLEAERKVPEKLEYADIDIPLTDPDLLRACGEMCAAGGVEWGRASDLSDMFLVNKHTLRDRSEVIQARRNAAYLRRSAQAHRSRDE